MKAKGRTLSKKHQAALERPKRPHGHECPICATPKTHRKHQLDKEIIRDKCKGS